MQIQTVTDQGDDLIATAARASFNRSAEHYTQEQNGRLLRYLVRSNPPHWAPYAHVRATFRMPHYGIIFKRLNANDKAGMVELRVDDKILDVSHSLWGWYILLRTKKVHFAFVDSVIDHLQQIAPRAALVLQLDSYRAVGGYRDKYETVQIAPANLQTDFVTLRITCPIVIARQLFKHQVGFVYSEASGRYIEYTKIYTPTALHRKPKNRKQGTGSQLGFMRSTLAKSIMKLSHAISYASYVTLHKMLGVAIEEARYTMPLPTATTFVVTGSRHDWQRVLDHRLELDAQTDIRVLAGLIQDRL